MIGKVNCNTPSFGARIVMTPYFKEGMYTVMCSPNRDEVNYLQKVLFLDAVSLIEQDKSMDEFKIEGVKRSTISPGKARKYQIVVDGKVEEKREGTETILDGLNCISAVIKFAKKRYGATFANKLTYNAAILAHDVDRIEVKLDEYVTDSLKQKFKLHKCELAENHKKVIDEISDKELREHLRDTTTYFYLG